MPNPERPGRARLLGILLIVVVTAAAGFGVSRFISHGLERVNGKVIASGTPVGSFTFSVSDCASGHAFVPGFFGADLRGEGGFDLRVVGSGDEAQLWLYPPGAKSGALPIGKQDCSRWDVAVDWARVTVNRVSTVSGHVRVACTAGGGTLTAEVDFTRCAF